MSTVKPSGYILIVHWEKGLATNYGPFETPDDATMWWVENGVDNITFAIGTLFDNVSGRNE